MVKADALEILQILQQLLPAPQKHWFNNRVDQFAVLWTTNRRQRKGKRFKTWSFRSGRECRGVVGGLIPSHEFKTKVAAAHWCRDNFLLVHFSTGTPPPSDSDSE